MWISGYGGYGADSNTTCCTAASFVVEPVFTGTHTINGKHWWIAPNLEWSLISNTAENVWAEHTCNPPPEGCPIEGSVWDPVNCVCTEGCPLILDTNGDGFVLTSHADGVLFDLNGDGIPEQVSWTQQDSDDGWLVLDRNGNGTIDNGRELFGNFTFATSTGVPPIAEHGFQALKATESATWQPSVPDGYIDPRDSVFGALRVWIDENHDGVSQPEELHRLRELGIVRLDTNFKPSRHVDKHGNSYRLRAQSYWKRGNGHIQRRLFYDVWLVLQ